jgi:hypothetical protein
MGAWLLYVVPMAFKVWMAVDAARRGAAYFWFYVILLLPFGEVIYFLAIKIDDFRVGRSRLFKKGVSLRRLEYNLRATPSVGNKLALAGALADKGHHLRAGELFREVLTERDDEKDALFGFATCAQKLGAKDTAIPALEHLMKLDPGYRAFDGAFALVDLYWTGGRKDEALALVETLSGRTARLDAQVRVARYRVQTDHKDQAIARLKRALDDYENSPWFARRGMRGWAKEARKILREAGSKA